MDADPPPERRKSRATSMWGVGLRTAARLATRQAARLLGRAADDDRFYARVGDDWFRTLGELKGAAMKLGQFASQFHGALPDALVERLSQLQQHAEPVPFSQLQPVLQSELGARLSRFDYLSPRPLASASIGQVHRGRLDDGTEVVVKILYPGVREAVAEDARHFARLLKTSRLLNVDAASMDAVVREVEARLAEETDYCQELANLHLMRDTGLPAGITLPVAVEALCTSRVLVLEHLPGRTLARAAQYSQATRNVLGERLMRLLAQQVLGTGVVHADPNPANFGFHGDGTVVMYDFGCVKRVPDVLRRQLLDVIRASAAGDWPALHRTLDDMGALRGPPDLETVRDLYRDWYQGTFELIRRQRPYDFADDRIHRNFLRLLGTSLPHVARFRPVPDLVYVNRTLNGYYWILRRLEPVVDVAGIIDEAAGAALSISN